MGHRPLFLKRGIECIEMSMGKVLRVSSVYETKAWGKTDQQDFLNQAVKIKSDMEPMDLLREIKKIEYSLGREKFEHWGPRVIDIDILLMGSKIIDEEGLQIPHKELENRNFALIPLAEISGDEIHPILGKSISELVRQCEDQLAVKKMIL